MTAPPEPWQRQAHVIIPHPAEPRVLMQPGAAGWSLPSVCWLADPAGPSTAERVRRAVLQALGLDVTVLRGVHGQDDEVRRRTEAIYALELHSPDREPPDGARWLGRADLTEVTLALPEQRPVVEAYLLEAEGGAIPELRPPWAQNGWLCEATTWLHARLAELGYTATGPVEQVRSWCLSSILRVHTTAGDVFFKTSPVPRATGPTPAASASRSQRSISFLFGNEPAVTRALAALYPEHVPTPLAIDGERGWMLLADFGPSLSSNQDPTVWEEALRLLGQLQLSSADHVDELVRLGCLDRRLDRLAAQVDGLLDDQDALGCLDAAERAQLHALGPRFQAMCGQLAGYRVPQTLVHGDFHPGNVALVAGRATCFDWTDACIAHPFFDLVTLLDQADALPDPPAARRRLRDAYLDLWTGYEPRERLLEAWALAEPLGYLHQAISYQHILASLEATSKWQCADGLPYFLRKALTSPSAQPPETT